MPNYFLKMALLRYNLCTIIFTLLIVQFNDFLLKFYKIVQTSPNSKFRMFSSPLNNQVSNR